MARSGATDLPPLRRNRDFQLLWAGQSLSSLGGAITTIALPLLVLALTHSPAKAGLTSFVAMLPLVLFSLPAGALLDRWRRKRVMVVAEVVRMAAAASLAVALWRGHAWFTLILIVAFVDITGYVFLSVGERAALRQIVPTEQLSDAAAQNLARDYGSTLVGKPLGGLLFGISRALPFVADAVSYVFSLASLLLIRSDLQERRAPVEARIRDEIREGVAWLWREPFLRKTSLLVIASDVNVNALSLAVIVMAKNQGASPSQIGIMSAFSGVGGVLGTLIAPRASKRLGPRAAIGTTFWAMAGLLPLLIVARGPFQLGAVFGAMFVAYPTWSALHGAYRAALVPDRLQARVQSVSMLVFLGPIPFGVLLAGITLQTLGSTPTILILLGLMVTVATVAVTSSTIRNAPTLEEAAQRSRLGGDDVLEVREPAPLA